MNRVHICINPTVTIEHEGEEYPFELTYLYPVPLDSKGEPRSDSAWRRIPKAVVDKVTAAHVERYPRAKR